MTAGVCFCSVELFVSIAKGAKLCFSYELLLNATCSDLRNYFPNPSTNGQTGA